MGKELTTHAHTIKGKYVVIDEGVSIGEGTSIWNLVYIGSRVRIGANVTVASLVHLAADVTVGETLDPRILFAETHATREQNNG